MTLREVIGHDRQKQILGRALAEHRLPPALLFAGPEGVGKRSLAMAVGRALLCERQEGDACDACGPCRRSSTGQHADLQLLEPKGVRIVIEQIRTLVAEVVARPFEAPARMFVVNDAHTMTPEAANALLKVLEEPPATSHLILVSGAPQALLPTIRSRCQRIRFSSLPPRLIEGYLAERVGVTPSDAALRARVCGGSLGAALAFESEAFRELREGVLTFLEGTAHASPLERMELAQGLAEEDDLALALTILRSLLRDIVALGEGVGVDSLQNPDVAERLSAMAAGALAGRAADVADAAGEAQRALKSNPNKVLLMEALAERMPQRRLGRA